MSPNRFIPVPATTLPNGLVVPAFQVGQYLCTAGEPHPEGSRCDRIGDRIPRAAAVTAEGYPWVEIEFAEAKKALAAAGLALITETQALAIAWDVSQQAVNWTGGKIGEGELFRGLHLTSVDCPMPGTYEPNAELERRWLQLSNGERIFDFAGNAYSWIHDDVQGDEAGLVAGRIEADSISLQAPYPSGEYGMGSRPTCAVDWSGHALFRGGCWVSGAYAGVFYLLNDWPDYAFDDVGFRCTNPGL